MSHKNVLLKHESCDKKALGWEAESSCAMCVRVAMLGVCSCCRVGSMCCHVGLCSCCHAGSVFVFPCWQCVCVAMLGTCLCYHVGSVFVLLCWEYVISSWECVCVAVLGMFFTVLGVHETCYGGTWHF